MTNDPLIGKLLGPYRLLEPIGQGGMATVYKAMQASMNRTVAVKILSPQMASNATFLARFKQEAQMIASLEHAHILPVYDLGEQDGIVYIAMRYMGFGSTQSRLASGPVPLQKVSRWMLQIASALDYAHQRGVVHRDVKPSNVLLDAQDDAFLSDFGIAKWMEGSLELTGSGMIGTPQYMSPEQGQGLKIDGRSDEYALGVMAYEMITGHPPFEAETPLAIVLKHVTEPLTPPIAINPRVPQPVSEVIVKALAKAPDDRYPTTLAFAEALDAAVRSSPVPATAPLPSSAEPTEEVHITQTRMRRKSLLPRPVWMALAMLGIVALGMGGAVLISANNQATPQAPGVVLTLGPNIQLQTPEPTPLPEITPIATSASITASGGCQQLYAETFDNPSSGLPSGEQDRIAWGYVNGEYGLLVKTANFFQTRLLGPVLTDYDVTVDARFATEATGDYGLAVAARDQDDYIALLVDGDRNYAVVRRTPNGSSVIKDWTFAPVINAGQQVNHLRAVQLGQAIAFYANDALLTIVTNTGDLSAERHVGLTAASFAQGLDARFDNLRVCQAPSSLARREISLIDSFDDNRNGWAPQRYSATGSTAIENGQFVITAIYNGQDYGYSDWNPNFAFDNFNLDVDMQITDGAPSSQIGVMFGVQDLDNNYLFRLTNDGRFVLYLRVEGSNQQIVDAQSSAAIKTDLSLNHVHVSVMTGTLSVAVNNQQVLQAAIAYSPGFVGFWCGAYEAGQTRCTFDNLAVTGAPSKGRMLVYPFCNCRRDVQLDQPLYAAWVWKAQTEQLLKEMQTKSTLSVTLDGQPVEQPGQYWGEAQPVDDIVQALWSYDLPTLDPGSHVLKLTVHSDEALTDGQDINGDGKPDTFGPGDFLVGYVEIIVQP